MRMSALATLVAASGLLAGAAAPAQDAKKQEDGPKQYVTHDGFVWKAWAGKGDRGVLTVSGVLKKKGGPGEYAYLQPAVPQGINPKILILEVKLGQLPGGWRSTDTGAKWKQVSGGAKTGLPAGPAACLAGDAGGVRGEEVSDRRSESCGDLLGG